MMVLVCYTLSISICTRSVSDCVFACCLFYAMFDKRIYVSMCTKKLMHIRCYMCLLCLMCFCGLSFSLVPCVLLCELFSGYVSATTMMMIPFSQHAKHNKYLLIYYHFSGKFNIGTSNDRRTEANQPTTFCTCLLNGHNT